LVGHFQTHHRSFSASGVDGSVRIDASPARYATRRAIVAARSVSGSLEYG